MIINLRELRRLDHAVERDGTLELPRVAKENVQVEAIQPVHAHLSAQLAQGLCRVEGDLETTITYRCSRCLEAFDSPLTAALDEVFSERETWDEDVHVVTGDEILIDPYIEQAINLTIEFRPLCKPDCQGLCPTCGTNQNHGSCGCEKRTVDPRLSILQDLLSNDNSL